MSQIIDRRTFIQSSVGFAGFAAIQPTAIPQRAVRVSVLGLGAGSLHRMSDTDSIELLQTAFLNGVTLFDAAAAYGDGVVETQIGKALHGVRDRIFLSSKTLRRDKQNALQDLRASLERLQTGALDLWMIHDLRTEDEWRRIAQPGGALQALQEAKQSGWARYVGLSANRNPDLVLQAMQTFPFDFIMTPVDADFASKVIPCAHRSQIGVLAIRVLGLPKKKQRTDGDVRRSIQSALSLPIASAVVGCENLKHLQENLRAVL
ncbi:MAG: aldo/keto reductase [Candidatus Omnitrophica bacterium]|nr:aldo/keto reductase [Candidatus Omnitrophota bacterium]